ncbi:hypothetical protein [Comamonas testosteroni]|uniref:hypothetical protein n=1 Tax=Comamonas testosteroni TaxID=285 RepID=UPI001C109A76|nr:hypothetical protein [Comamonas testosteroni]
MTQSTMRRRAPNPAIPGTRRDRTGSTLLLRKALVAINERWKRLTTDVLAAFERIPVYALNDTGPQVAYGITPAILDIVLLEIAAALDRWVQNGKEPKELFWWNPFVEQASQLGALQSVTNLTNLSEAYAASRSFDQVVRSEPYLTRVALARMKSYEHWTGLRAEGQSRLAGIIGRAVADGLNPKAARTLIVDGLGVTRSKAAQYAQTDITDTLRQARWAESEAAQVQYGLKIGMLWTSALLPTTRATHATRNGRVYSTDEVRAFYGRDGNRYNCFLPGTRVAGRFVAGSKARYKGPVVTLMSAAGGEISVTPNHPVVTQRGLIPAAEVQKGDYLVADRTKVENPLGVVHLNGDLVAPRIEDVFGALMDAGESSLVGVSGVDFHGDAAFMDEHVEVVRSERVLAFAMDAARAKLLDDLAFVKADAPTLGTGSLGEFIHGNGSATHGSLGGCGVGLALITGELGHADNLCGTARAGMQSGQREPSHDGGSIHADAFADGQHGLTLDVCFVEGRGQCDAALARPFIPAEAMLMEELHQRAVANSDAVGNALVRLAGLAAFDEVVDVVWGEFDGHVFDLQEVSGLMLGSNFAVSNCHCGQTECLLDASGKPILTERLQKTMVAEREAWSQG